MKQKPSIAELEALLNSEDDTPVTINPNGTISPTAYGWAVVDPDGKINVRTVCDTRRAALVNWLVTEKKRFITAFDSDETIERWWSNWAGDRICTTVSVTVTPR